MRESQINKWRNKDPSSKNLPHHKSCRLGAMAHVGQCLNTAPPRVSKMR